MTAKQFINLNNILRKFYYNNYTEIESKLIFSFYVQHELSNKIISLFNDKNMFKEVHKVIDEQLEVLKLILKYSFN